ncbi:arsenite S-adenosylmethyltransferase [Formosa agariphila KMM 3901]|uniref:Arsenite methyltransferase n=1 Tax=Formosa agariphila (strain DSM 15362 / KCTC 12365 / LMG 23005 / KMM 3901 / M-2Alg 35-1) TaxID=1347342 RepID=T2KGH5_FORAG|nr:arsenite methyltransferase [Formosa agariphila]CDF77860.1 arsenite S-adenosylmethyltransferase [Formosa agariphila KMM 3901]
MNKEQELKNIVKERYTTIAEQGKAENASSCCGATTSSNKVYNIMMDDYSATKGYVEDADLGLGCGLPTQFAKIKSGDTVIDLGSGAGNDAFVARHETGAAGKVIGIDFTPIMIEKARANADKLGYNNVEFREGDIDNMPVSDNTADVIVSNCVLNLVPNKTKVISEIHRVLKPSGHFSISDVVLVGELPQALKEDAEMYAGCVAGAIQKSEYIQTIENQGFKNVTIQKEKPIVIPDDILKKYLSTEEVEAFNTKTTGIFSITVYAEKQGGFKSITTNNSNTCTPGGGCC